MSDSNELKITITGESSQLKGAMSDASGAVQAATGQISGTFSSLQSNVASAVSSVNETTGAMKNAFSSLGSTAQSALSGLTQQIGEVPGAMGGMMSGLGNLLGALNPLKSVLTAVTEAVGALGLIFRSAANEEEKYVTSMMTLARSFGITVQEAQTVGQAIEEISAHYVTGEVSTDSLTTAFKRFARQVATNEAGLEALGLHLRDDVTGEMRNSFDIFMEAIDHMKTLGGETAKMGFAAQLFGRGMSADMITVLEHLSKETLAEANKKLTETGRLIGPEMVAKVQASKEATLALKDAWAELTAHISTVAIPVWTTFKELMASIPEIFSAIINAVTGTTSAFQELDNESSEYYRNLAKEQGAAATPKVADIMPKHEKTGGEPENIKKPKVTPPESRMTEWEADLKQQEILEKSFFADSKANELAYWQEKLNAAHLLYGELWAIQGKMYEAEKSMAVQAHASELADLQAGMRDSKLSWNQRILDAMEAASVQARTYGEDSAEYKKAVAEKMKLEEEEAKFYQAEAAKRIDADIKVNDEILKAAQKHSAALLAQGKITVAQQIAMDEQAASQAYAVEEQKLEEELALYDRNDRGYEATLEKMRLAHQKYVDAIQADEDKTATATKKQWAEITNELTGPFESALKIVGAGILDIGSKGQTWQTTMVNACQQVIQGFEQIISKIVMAIAKTEILSALGLAGGAGGAGAGAADGIAGAILRALGLTTVASTTLQTAGVGLNAASVSLNTAAVALDSAAAALTASSGTSSAGGIGGVFAAAPMLFAERGFDVPPIFAAPGGFNISSNAMPLTQLHPNEMVLPADLANGVRDMTARGGGGGMGGNISIKALDSQDVARALMNSRHPLARAVKQMYRDRHLR